MADKSFCILCGLPISDIYYERYPRSRYSWRAQFRVVYSSPSGPGVSGVGRIRSSRPGKHLVPLDYKSWWWQVKRSSLVEIGVMAQSPINDHHGFVFHHACGKLLKQTYYPQPVPYERLLAVCKSLPCPWMQNLVSWGHDYDGAVKVEFGCGLPWDAPFAHRYEPEYPTTPPTSYVGDDPFDTFAVKTLLASVPRRIWEKKKPLFTQTVFSGDNGVTKLPQELRDQIAVYLSVQDAINLSKASRVFTPITSKQHFWHTRFHKDAEYGHIFEARDNGKRQNWKLICQHASHFSREMENRKRVWGLVMKVKDVMDLRRSESPKSFVSRQTLPSLEWNDVSGHVQSKNSKGTYTFHQRHDSNTIVEYPVFPNGCCVLFFEHCVLIPQPLRRIAFFIVRVGEVEYIAGIKLISSDNRDIYLGYQGGRQEGFDISGLNGFCVAVTPGGIRALQVISGDGSRSHWIGDPEKAPKTRRLIFSHCIEALKAGFDGFKMVSLAVGNAMPDQSTTTVERNPLENGLWYPGFPRPNLFMSNSSYLDEHLRIPESQPLLWTLFGGPGGIYLRSLVGVTVTYLDCIRSIEFKYDTSQVPDQCRFVGLPDWSKTGLREHLAIDVPGGEIIESVAISKGEYCASCVKSITIKTSLGQEVVAGAQGSPEEPPVGPSVVESLQPNRGATITGFYTSVRPGVRTLSGLGIMSEEIHDVKLERRVKRPRLRY